MLNFEFRNGVVCVTGVTKKLEGWNLEGNELVNYPFIIGFVDESHKGKWHGTTIAIQVTDIKLAQTLPYRGNQTKYFNSALEAFDYVKSEFIKQYESI